MHVQTNLDGIFLRYYLFDLKSTQKPITINKILSTLLPPMIPNKLQYKSTQLKKKRTHQKIIFRSKFYVSIKLCIKI